jgi:type IV pilus assembly protein PilW
MLNIKHNKIGFSRDSGFTLIELMLAMLLGLIIMGGVMKLYVTTRDTQRTSEDQMQLIADARFVMQTMAFDLRHAGIWGGMNETKLIACKKDSEVSCPLAVGAVTDDCDASKDWYIDLDRPVIAFNNANPYVSTCAKEGYKADTDVLGIHYADTIAIPTGDLATGVVYVRSNIRNGMLFVGDTYPATTSLYKWIDTPLDSVTKNYPLKSVVYYVSEYTDDPSEDPKIPSLRKVELSQGPIMKDTMLIPGVEDFQLEFGLDTTGDFQVNSYVSADTVTNDDWLTGKVIAVKVWLLMRAEHEDRDAVGGDQTFKLAGDATGVTYTDGVRRFLVTDVVRLRNTARVDLLSAGK